MIPVLERSLRGGNGNPLHILGEYSMENILHILHAWKIPWTEEPGGLQLTGSQRVGPIRTLSTHRIIQ